MDFWSELWWIGLMVHESITEAILGAAYEVYNVLGHGFLEKVYERALAVELKRRGVNVRTQHEAVVAYKGENVGKFVTDLLVERAVAVEVKAVSEIHPDHVKQCLNFIRAGGWSVGLVVNFGPKQVEKRRVINTDGTAGPE